MLEFKLKKKENLPGVDDRRKFLLTIESIP